MEHIKNKEKLVVCIMGQNADRFIEMCLKSVKDSDAIVFCDGGSTDGTIDYLKRNGFKYSPADCKKNIIFQDYKQLDKEMNGKQRNYYLEYIKKIYPDYWCLAIDVDEVVEDLSKIKEFIKESEHGIYSVKMRHLIGDLSHEDATQEYHYVLHRLFKISKAGEYPEVEHPVLLPQKEEFEIVYQGNTNCTTIWHLAYCPNMWEIKKRYENHLLKSNMHTPEYLKDWYTAHLFGTYPRKQLCLDELPGIILNHFGLSKDEIYFRNRRDLNTKHFLDAIYLKELLNSRFKNPQVIEFGCGTGMRVWCMNKIGLNAVGTELSKYAVINSFMPNKTKYGDITDNRKIGNFNLSMAYDVLEHVSYEDLDKAIDTLIKNTNYYIITSIPYKGTPNCEADSTHLIKESRDWWVKKFTDKKLKEIKVPDHFLFKEQLLIFEKNKQKIGNITTS